MSNSTGFSMRKRLEDYRNIVGDEVMAQIYRKARRLYGKHILHINSTYQGGGVAEMLWSLVPLMNDIGLDAGWRIVHGTPDFFNVTKKFHNGIQGEKVSLSEDRLRLYEGINEIFASYTHIRHDFVIVHDPQPLPLISFYKKRQPWIWRCHTDISTPHRDVWNYLKKFILRYDTVIVSSEKYKKHDLPVEQVVIFPAIDPLTDKNKELSEETIKKVLAEFNIPTDKPLITQVSRFDKWKDPLGVVEVFERVKEKVDARLVLIGSMAADDPEGWEIYRQVEREVEAHEDIKDDIILITVENNILVNALQRVSSVVLQKSIREGFGLTVSEAMWKGTPVVASNVGGIPTQVIDGETGFLVDPLDYNSAAEKVITLLKDRKLAEEMGKKGKEHVRKNFLITRLLMDYLDLFNHLLNDFC